MVLELFDAVWRRSGIKHFCFQEKQHCYKKLAHYSGEKEEFSVVSYS